LPDSLSIAHWVRLRYPDPDNQLYCDDRIKRKDLHLDRKILTTDMVRACNDGHLKYEEKTDSYLIADSYISLSGWARGPTTN
jgi:hypothetical protein